MKRSAFAALRVAVVAVLFTLVLPMGSAGAVSSAVVISEVSSSCSGWLSWQGYSSHRNPSLNTAGTVRYCVRKYKASDSNSTKDFYLAVVQADVRFTGSNRGSEAASTFTITSNRTAYGNDYGASPTISGSSCTQPLSVGIGYGPIGISFNPTICSGGSITRNSYTSTKGVWSTTKFGSIENWESIYVQAVPQGTVPTFTFSLQRPKYTIVSNRSTAGYSTTTLRA